MRMTERNCFTMLGAAVITAAGLVGPASAHDGHDHGGAQHGGTQHGGVEAKTERHHFEAVFTKEGVRLYARGADHKAIDASRLSATATFHHPNAPEEPWFSRQLAASGASPGQAADSLGLAIDLGKVPEKGAKVAFRVAGLPDPEEPEASFTVPLTFAGGGLVVATATAADQKAIEALKVCPVSHDDLGSMGTPLKVTRDGRSTFLCCKGCLKQLQANPEEFLGDSDGARHNDHEH